MFNLQGSEIIFILLLALVVLGPEKLPGAIRRFTRTYAELKKMGSSFQDEVKTAFDEPMREVRETADLIKQQVDVDSLEADHEQDQRAQDQRDVASAFATGATTLAPTGAPPDTDTDTDTDAATDAAADSDHDGATDADDGADSGLGQGQHPDTAYRPLQPPVAGTARPGPLPNPEDSPDVPPPPPAAAPGPTPIPPPPAPFAASHPPAPPAPDATGDGDEGATSP